MREFLLRPRFQRLVRTKLHTVQLGDMKPGGLRALNSSELTSLYKAVEM